MSAATPSLPFTAPWLLAPMEGVTEPCFRDLVLDLHPPAALGGAFTEFVRVVRTPVARGKLAEALGPDRRRPVGLQLMGSDPGPLAESAVRAVEAGAVLVDLNFGCPSKGALRGCAGSALLDDPSRVETLVRAVTTAVTDRPVSAKIRAGGEDDSLLEDLARAVEAGGARLLTVHARTRREGYAAAAPRERLARASAAVEIPVCGNGGIEHHADLEALRRATGCAFAMVGRAALGDPWIFSGMEVGRREAARFLLAYAQALRLAGASGRKVAGRLKQLLGHWRAGGLASGGDGRVGWLRERDPARLLERLRRMAGEEGGPPGPPSVREGLVRHSSLAQTDVRPGA